MTENSDPVSESGSKVIRILGCGSPLMGDDGVGIRIVEKLTAMAESDERLADVEILDVGVCGLDLLGYLDGADYVIMTDAVKADLEPGKIIKMSGRDLIDGNDFGRALSAHDIAVPDVLKIAEVTQGLPEITIFGVIIPVVVGDVFDMSYDLSPSVQPSVDRVIPLILDEIARIRSSSQTA